MKQKKGNIDWERAYNDLVKSLKSLSHFVSNAMPDDEDEVEYATACGFLICCQMAIEKANHFISEQKKEEKADD